ncbi:hypothetical protein acsn021_00510 [Anaerocolumna cellulosilytica]|uniref:Uncharacterized protein n=1 Tax=Anaerocolumna cellulosilytica TaxID=433286 RepID=A0A6S6QYX9_9FIRM|nr:DUF6382 domain-containing protein [Anaerocolumna cellulosilytica]MBB5196198.1 hypothetical protein [Anaerocolumna cellulosilytica]BCJ92482.1 hypothetical protein acsn021_00510 [Anaerocolumna cellulosilytica]
MLKPEYIRDMNYNYMVFKGEEGGASSHGIKMLLNNTIPGLLRMELRCIDTLNLYYYDITSLRSIDTIYERESLSYHVIKNLLEGILNSIKCGNEYLLSEKDYIITPEYIFMDAKETIKLCYMAGFCEDFFSQISKLLEFLLNKVDYKEEAAVLLVYALYKESREPDTTFDKLQAILKKQFTNEILVKKITMEENNQAQVTKSYKELQVSQKAGSSLMKSTTVSNQDGFQNGEGSGGKPALGKSFNRLGNGIIKQKNNAVKQKDNGIKNNKSLTNKDKNKSREFVKLQREKVFKNNKESKNIGSNHENRIEIENQKEFQYYGIKAFILGGISLLGGTACLIVGFMARLFQNNLGTGTDLVKLLSCIVVLLCLEGYILTKIFDPKNRQIKYITLLEYADTNEAETKGSVLYSEQREGNQASNICSSSPQLAGSQEENGQYCNVSNEMLDEQGDTKHTYNDTEDKNIMLDNSTSEEYDNATVILWQGSSGNEDMDKTVILADLTPTKQYFILQLPQFVAESNDTDKRDNLPDEKLEIKKFPFGIGKQDRGNQLVIKHSTISRKHAVITKEGDRLFLTDLHSTNGTFVNGKPLLSNQPMEITEFDEIKFSDISYRIEVLTI